jgi:hypothetical protein
MKGRADFFPFAKSSVPDVRELVARKTAERVDGITADAPTN